MLTDRAGSSAWLLAGWVVYSNESKQRELAVPAKLLKQHGAVSVEVVASLVRAARQRSGADLAVAISGIAGPGGSEFKPEGRVCFALACAQGTQSETQEFGALGRPAVRQAALDHALNLIRVHLNSAH